MGNELTPQANSYITNTEDYFALVAAEADNFREGGGLMYLKFDGNTGEYSYGSDKTELKLGSLLALNIKSYRRGWICWNDGEVVDEIMVPLHEGTPPAKTSLTNHGPYVEPNDGWSEQYTIEMRMVEEPYINLLFQANNTSKRIAFQNMMKDFSKGFRLNEGCAPVIEIDEREFEGKAKEGKRKYKKHAPIFKIVDWKSLEELAALAEGSPDDYEPEENAREEPATSRRTASRRDEPEDEAPRRSSRRDEEEDERPRRSAARRDDPVDEEDERPRRSASRRDEDEDEDQPRTNRAEPRANAGGRKPSF